MSDTLSTEAAIAFLRKIFPNGIPKKTIDNQAEVLKLYLLAEQRGTLIKESSSLHCWSEDFMLNGTRYSFVGVIGEGSPSSVVELQ